MTNGSHPSVRERKARSPKSKPAARRPKPAAKGAKASG